MNSAQCNRFSDKLSSPKNEFAMLNDRKQTPQSGPGESGRETTIDEHGNQDDLTRIETGVSVERAEAEFVELNDHFCKLSQKDEPFAHAAGHAIRAKNIDIEKDSVLPQTVTEPWNLEQTLRGLQNEETASGIKTKRIGVIWDDLTVSGVGGTKHIIKTFPQEFISFFSIAVKPLRMLGIAKKVKEFDILKSMKGVVKPGEMVLVLGRPGSGCTTFLKVISNQRFGYTNVHGEVLFGPYDFKTFRDRFRGEAVYNGENDIHSPTLTVRQTLGFALDLKTPRRRPGNMSKREFKEKVINLLLKMFNIEHTVNTMVGNQYIRGISGGERKRVSIAEMMVTSACVCAWDNTTRGLDASSAVDYAKSLRIMTNLYKTTTFVSLYQASESIYDQFDKVIIIDEGRQIFIGPVSEARSYFENLGFKASPRQTTPNFLTGCTSPSERQYRNGFSEANVPSSAISLAKAFEGSSFAIRLAEEMTAYREQIESDKHLFVDFETANRDAKHKHTPKSSVYSSPFYLQVRALARRQFHIKWQDKTALAMSWILSVVVAIVLGTVWFNLGKTSAGAFTRGGVLFLSVFFCAIDAFGEIPAAVLGRAIRNKHRAYAFHRPSALYIAQVLVDLSFGTLRILVFSLLVYFLCNLVRDAGAFFIFYLVMLTVYIATTIAFRTM